MITGRVLHQLKKGSQAIPLFELNQVSVSFGDRQALRGVQLTLFPGDVVFVTGASGAGKTTLLHLLAGLVDPTVGQIARPRSDHFLACVFQDLRLLQKLSGEENLWLAYDSSVYGNKNEFHTEMMDLAGYLGIKDHLSQKVDNYNGGVKQKLAMLRALLSRPSVLLADEPTSSLDRDNAFKVFELVNLYNHRKGMTVIWATHNRDQIKQYPGKMAHLDQGKLLYSGQACFI